MATRPGDGGTIRFMTDGFVVGRSEGERVSPAMTLKVGGRQSQTWSMFEVVDIGPGFDVGAHLHRNAEELFYVLDGQLDLLAFEPRIRTSSNWQGWESRTGASADTAYRPQCAVSPNGGAGSAGKTADVGGVGRRFPYRLRPPLMGC